MSNELVLTARKSCPFPYSNFLYAVRYGGKRAIIRTGNDAEYQHEWYDRLSHVEWIPNAYFYGKIKIGNKTEHGMVMDYVPGVPFDTVYWSLIPRKTRNRIADNLYRALDKIHAEGLVHGDLHTANVILTPRMSFRIIDPMINCSPCDEEEMDSIVQHVRSDISFPVAIKIPDINNET